MHEAGHPKPVLWDNPAGKWGSGGGRSVQDGGTHVYLWPIHADVWQKNHNIVIILQLNKLIFKKKKKKFNKKI